MSCSFCRLSVGLVIGIVIGAPCPSTAQLSRADSAGIAAAIAPALRGAINGQGVAQDNATLLQKSAAWNRWIQDALAAIDSTVIAGLPTRTTARFNVFTADASGDSIALNIGVTQCNGLSFAGISDRYVVKRGSAGWVVAGKRFSGSGHGRCDQATRQDSGDIIAAIDQYSSTRGRSEGIWFVAAADSSWTGRIARATRAGLAIVADTVTSRCNSGVPMPGPVGNRAAARLVQVSPDSAEVRITLRCTGGMDVKSLRPLGSVLMYALTRRDGRWRVASLRAAAG